MLGFERGMKSLGVLLLVASSCFYGAFSHPQSTEDDLRLCYEFRRLNKLGKSYRDPEFLGMVRTELAKKGKSKAAILHAEDHDRMARDFYCPDVW